MKARRNFATDSYSPKISRTENNKKTASKKSSHSIDFSLLKNKVWNQIGFLLRFPIKSCANFPPPSSFVKSRGFAYRNWGTKNKTRRSFPFQFSFPSEHKNREAKKKPQFSIFYFFTFATHLRLSRTTTRMKIVWNILMPRLMIFSSRKSAAAFSFIICWLSLLILINLLFILRGIFCAAQ